MRVKGITEADLRIYLHNVNAKHGYKLIFNREPEKRGNYIHFTIRSEKSGIPGARTSWSGRNMVSASWHSHGYLFDEIWEHSPNAIIYSGNMKMTNKEDNWQDRNIGSMINPVMFSQTSIL